MKKEYKNTGQLIREFRKAKGLTQMELSESVGVSYQQIQKYESGSTKMNTDKLQQVANALKVPVSAFFDENTLEKPPLSDKEQKLIKAFRRIEEEDIQESFLKILSKSGKGKAAL